HLGTLSPADSIWMAEALHELLPKIARTAKASLVVLKDFPSKYRATLAGFSANGFTRVPSMPMTRLALNFRDFDDYLAHLSYGTRKSLRRKFAKPNALPKSISKSLAISHHIWTTSSRFIWRCMSGRR